MINQLKFRLTIINTSVMPAMVLDGHPGVKRWGNIRPMLIRTIQPLYRSKKRAWIPALNHCGDDGLFWTRVRS